MREAFLNGDTQEEELFRKGMAMIDRGCWEELKQLFREEPDALGAHQVFSMGTPLLMEVWKANRTVVRQILVELCKREEGAELISFLEALTINFFICQEGMNYEIFGNFLFQAVWDGEYSLVKMLLECGMNPNGTCCNNYYSTQIGWISPDSRWGRMIQRGTMEPNEFDPYPFDNRFSFEVCSELADFDLISPLYLARLQRDKPMVELLLKQGAYDVQRYKTCDLLKK